MMQTINTYLPSVTLGAMLLALWMLSTSQQQTQAYVVKSEQAQQRLINITTEQERISRIMQNDLAKLESAQTELRVRLVRIESDLCRQIKVHTVQCP